MRLHIFFLSSSYRLEKSRSHSSEETETNRRQLPKKPQRQNNIRDDREPTPDYDSTGDKSTDKSPLATSPIKKSPNQLEQSGGSSDNQTRGKKKKSYKKLGLLTFWERGKELKHGKKNNFRFKRAKTVLLLYL